MPPFVSVVFSIEPRSRWQIELVPLHIYIRENHFEDGLFLHWRYTLCHLFGFWKLIEKSH